MISARTVTVSTGCAGVAPRLRKAGVMALILVVVTLIGWHPAQAQADDPSEQQAAVEQRQAEVAAQVDTMRASDAEVTAALSVLTTNVAAQRDRLADTQRALATATAALETVKQDEERAQGALADVSQRLQTVAVDSYIRPPDDAAGSLVLTGSAIDAPKRRTLAGFRSRSLADAVDQVKAKRQDLDRAHRQAAAAQASVAQAQATEGSRLHDLEAAAEQQRGVVSQLEDRLDHALGEAAALAAQHQALGVEIGRQQAALAAQMSAARQQSAGYSSAPASSNGPSMRQSGSVSVTSIRGIEVSFDIAPQLVALLTAADAAGIALDGSGYRNIDEQIQLRIQHCGSSDYAIWEMPSSDCSPPVARPGRSMHEQGLAVDFIVGGDLIRSRSSAAYRWLAANAERSGFYNLPSEPWHWSTTGA